MSDKLRQWQIIAIYSWLHAVIVSHRQALSAVWSGWLA